VALTTSSVEVLFSEEVERESAEAAFQIAPPVEGAYSWSGSTLVFTPTQRLPLETEFSVSVGPGVRDLAGNEMPEASVPFEFATVGNPTVVAATPEDGESDVALDTQVVLEFSTLMDTASVESALTTVPIFEAEASWSGETLTLTPVEPLEENTRYTITIGTAASDGAGNSLEEPYRLNFRTAVSALEPLVLVPADGVEGAAVTSSIAVILDTEVDADTLTDDALTLEPSVAGSLSVTSQPGAAGLRQPADRMLIFNPSAPLAPNTTYEVTLAGDLAGTDGSRLAGPVSWRFTTGSPLTTLSNQIVFLSERGGISNLWAMNPDGSAARQVSAELSPVSSYAVAPDGRTVILGDGAILVRQRADGSGREVLTPDGVLEVDPAWAPNGQRFAFGRIDAPTGTGLGLWTRDADGGDASELELPAELRATPQPTGEDDEREPVLRAPRYSPDGSALAFVTDSGRVGVLELPGGRVTTAGFTATSPPAWLTDSSAVLVAGLEGELAMGVEAGEPLPELDPAALELSGVQLGSQVLVQLDRGDSSVRDLQRDGSPARPVAGVDGGYLYIALQPGAPLAGGELRLVDADSDRERAPLDDSGPAATSATPGLEPDSLVVARAARTNEPGGASRAGIWLVDARDGRSEQLSSDGWSPRWLP
ncbi:MAG TPA: Ig-like domain-containing protein, partial [Candidatus Limnocylindria bacterium]|nr:Ig-like domain-containing protein [Candidatus Limnocylindria bacterium]